MQQTKWKKPKRAGVPLHVHIDPALDAALCEYLQAASPAVFKTAAVEAALRDFLARMGHWPPAPKKEGE